MSAISFGNLVRQAVDYQKVSAQEPKELEAQLVKTGYELDENKREAEFKKMGYTLDRGLSDTSNSVIRKDGQTYQIIRGTKTQQDLSDDISLVLGQEKSTKSFQKSKEIFNKIKGEKPILVGHSLGSAKLEYVLTGEKDIKGIAYASPLVGKKSVSSNITQKFHKDDIVSKPISSLLTGRFNLSKHSLGNY